MSKTVWNIVNYERQLKSNSNKGHITPNEFRSFFILTPEVIV